MELSGVGDLYLAFERLRRTLAKEGLFDQERKRPAPAFPRKIAVITSATGAAVHDVLTTLRVRWPLADVILIPTAVSGKASEIEIVEAVSRLNVLPDAEVAILARGGGSMEEMVGFNAEPVARAIAGAPIPIVTGIGHETDVTIADFAADLRAPTPTGAAVAATPDRGELVRHVCGLRERIGDSLRRRTDRYRRELDLLRARPVLRRPSLLLAERRQRLDETIFLLRHRLSLSARNLAERLRRAHDKLAALAPRAVLERGYSITRLPDGTIVRSARQVSAGTRAEVVFAHGSAEVDVRKTSIPEEERDSD
jgi:exodeoxyribonuclease VII large subunit